MVKKILRNINGDNYLNMESTTALNSDNEINSEN